MFLVLYWCSPPAGPRLCPFHWLTGLDCPLCGLTRGLFALAKGHWTDAVRLNALAPLAAIMLLALIARGRWVGALWMGGLGAFAIYGVFRVVA